MNPENGVQFLMPVIGQMLVIGICCGCQDKTSLVDSESPTMPKGIISITGDRQIVVEWFPNGERDLAGYHVWRSQDGQDFTQIATLGKFDFQYADLKVRNGITYHYKVSAFDQAGNESRISLETIQDTPRPAGTNITLTDFKQWPEESGFDFSAPNRGAVDLAKGCDIYFGFDDEVGAAYLYSVNGTKMQDVGYPDHFADLDQSPVRGFTTKFLEILEGHIYAFYLPGKNFAKVHVKQVSTDSVTFDWALQIDRENPQLAPILWR